MGVCNSLRSKQDSTPDLLESIGSSEMSVNSPGFGSTIYEKNRAESIDLQPSDPIQPNSLKSIDSQTKTISEFGNKMLDFQNKIFDKHTKSNDLHTKPTSSNSKTPVSISMKKVKISPSEISEIPSFRSIQKAKSVSPRNRSTLSESSDEQPGVYLSKKLSHTAFFGVDSPLMSAPPSVDKSKEFVFPASDKRQFPSEVKHTKKLPEFGNAAKPHNLPSSLRIHHLGKSEFSITKTLNLKEKESYSSSESLPQCSDENSSNESPSNTTNKQRRPPSKFLKRAQSFSQFLKKKPPPAYEKRKKSGGSVARDEYYLPINHEEQQEQPMGELMLVPLDKLVMMDDLE